MFNPAPKNSRTFSEKLVVIRNAKHIIKIIYASFQAKNVPRKQSNQKSVFSTSKMTKKGQKLI
jgi:hypothetical protein